MMGACCGVWFGKGEARELIAELILEWRETHGKRGVV